MTCQPGGPRHFHKCLADCLVAMQEHLVDVLLLPHDGFLVFLNFGDGPNTVSESTVSNTELSEFFCSHRLPGKELSEFLSAAKRTHRVFRRTHRVCHKTQ